MCDGAKLLRAMAHLQVKREPLYCRPGPGCWCAQLAYRIEASPHPTGGECMSPKEMLECHGDKMGETDRRYLQSLLGKEFIQD